MPSKTLQLRLDGFDVTITTRSDACEFDSTDSSRGIRSSESCSSSASSSESSPSSAEAPTSSTSSASDSTSTPPICSESLSSPSTPQASPASGSCSTADDENVFVVGSDSQMWVANAIVVGPARCGNAELRDALVSANARVRNEKKFYLTALAKSWRGKEEESSVQAESTFCFNVSEREDVNKLKSRFDRSCGRPTCLLVDALDLSFLAKLEHMPSALFVDVPCLTPFARKFLVPAMDAVFVNRAYSKHLFELAGVDGKMAEALEPFFQDLQPNRDGQFVAYFPRTGKAQALRVDRSTSSPPSFAV